MNHPFHLEPPRAGLRGAARVDPNCYNVHMNNDLDGVSARELKRKLLEEAHRLGFDLAGVTTPDPPDHLDVYREWLGRGRHGQMGYLASERGRRLRADPRELLPQCQSILVLAMNYLPESQAANRPNKGPQVATYAMGDDYHDVIPERLQSLVTSLEGWLGKSIPHRIYTDTGPILERELAQRAGLGWIGKNTCLIHPDRGSYFFLAEVLLGLALPSDDPLKTDHCGSCTRCLEACPTECILPDRTLDARRCISYLTIELRGEIPPDLRSAIDDWVFGCDICQQVCPWNQRFARPTAEPAYQPRQFLLEADPCQYLSMQEDQFRRVFRGSPIKRAKRRGLVRNAAVVAGNGAREESVPALRKLLFADSEPLVRRHAAWSLGQIGSRDALQALHDARQTERNEEVQAEIAGALQEKPLGDEGQH